MTHDHRNNKVNSIVASPRLAYNSSDRKNSEVTSGRKPFDTFFLQTFQYIVFHAIFILNSEMFKNATVIHCACEMTDSFPSMIKLNEHHLCISERKTAKRIIHSDVIISIIKLLTNCFFF